MKSKKKPKRLAISDVTVDSGPDENGHGMYVSIELKNASTWLYPQEARALAKALLRHSRPVRRSTVIKL